VVTTAFHAAEPQSHRAQAAIVRFFTEGAASAGKLSIELLVTRAIVSHKGHARASIPQTVDEYLLFPAFTRNLLWTTYYDASSINSVMFRLALLSRTAPLERIHGSLKQLSIEL
jgi:hypothetical protein